MDCWGLAPESRPPGLVQAKRKKALDCLVALSVRQELVGSSTFAAMARLTPHPSSARRPKAHKKKEKASTQNTSDSTKAQPQRVAAAQRTQALYNKTSHGKCDKWCICAFLMVS